MFSDDDRGDGTTWYQTGDIINLIKNAKLMLKPSTCITTNMVLR